MMSAAQSMHYTPDPDALTPRERAIVEAWNAAYPADAVDVTVWGHGKIAMRAVFEAEAKRRWVEIVGKVDKETRDE